MKIMLKILLVDDEILARNYIRTLITWEKYEYSICGEANNGQTAIEMIKTHHPDIVLVDVSMPIMDGVALIKYINEKSLKLKVIMLSSYQDYEYVREAMKNGALDYLLKHRLSSEELLGVLERARNSILKEKEANDLEKISEKDSIQESIKQDNIRRLILGIIDEKESNLDSFRYKKLNNSVIVVIQIIDYVLLYNKYTENERYHLRNSIVSLGYQVTEDISNEGIIYIDRGRYAILFNVNAYRSEAEISQRITTNMCNLSSTILRYFNLQISWARSPVCARYNSIPLYYSKVCEKLEGKDTGSSVSKDYKTVKDKVTPLLSISQEKNLLSAIDSLKYNELEHILTDIFIGLKEYSHNVSSVQIVISELITIVTKVCNREKIELRELCNMDDLHLEEIDKTLCWLRELYKNLILRLSENKSDESYSLYVNETIKYMHKNYQRNISLTDTAEYIGITPSYLSHLFKKETGKSFIEHLNYIRIQIAIEAIKEDKIKINNIYKKVGFNNYNYFFQVFKNITGNSPANYIKNS